MESCAALGSCSRVVMRFHWCVLLFWGVIFYVGSIGARRFPSKTTTSASPPDFTKAKIANDHVETLFPSVSRTVNWVAVLAVNPPRKVLEMHGIQNFSYALRDSLNSSGQLTGFISNSTLWFDQKLAGESTVVSTAGTTMIVQWSIYATELPLEIDKIFRKNFKEELQQWLPDIDFGGITSGPTLGNEALEDTGKSLSLMDTIAMPVAMFVLWSVVKSARLLVIPLVTICVALSASFGIMYLVACKSSVQSTTPSIMMSILIAMSIDYCLFLLTRFREEMCKIIQGCDEVMMTYTVYQVVVVTMKTSGFTVLLSGCTLALAFLVLVFIPTEFISSLGVGAFVALLTTLAVHLTLVPALLSAFPIFFARSASLDRCEARWSKACTGRTAARDVGGSGAAVEMAAEPNVSAHGPGPLLQQTDERPAPVQRSFWGWLARVTTTGPWNALIVIAVIGCTATVGRGVLHTKVSNDFLLNIPRNTEVLASSQRLKDDFGMGMMSPYNLVLEPGRGNPGKSVLNQEFWEKSQSVFREMATRLPNTEARDVASLSYMAGQPVPWMLMSACLGRWVPPWMADTCRQLKTAIDKFSNPERSALSATIALTKIDPMGPEGFKWLRNARDLVDELANSTDLRLTLNGPPADMIDSIEAVYASIPLAVGMTMIVALVILGMAFGSLVIPLRCITSIVLTILFVFGAAVWTYQDGMLNWTGIDSLSSEFDSQCWILPVLNFSLAVGLCLDYDIFLLSRITEYRQEGLSTTEAVRQGLCATGGIITAAGMVMAIAFGGLMFSHSLTMNGTAFYLMVTVIYDTFICRCLFVPAVMSLLGRFSWYPSKLSRADW